MSGRTEGNRFVAPGNLVQNRRIRGGQFPGRSDRAVSRMGAAPR